MGLEGNPKVRYMKSWPKPFIPKKPEQSRTILGRVMIKRMLQNTEDAEGRRSEKVVEQWEVVGAMSEVGGEQR